MMKKTLPFIIAGALFLVIITFQITHNAVDASYRKKELEACQTQSDEKTEKSKLQKISELFETYCVRNYGEEDGFFEDYADLLGDRYSFYLSKEEYDKIKATSHLCGLGITVRFDKDKQALEIIGSKRKELNLGDHIISVNGKNVSDIGYAGAVSEIKGEEGTLVELVLETQNGLSEISLKRTAFEDEVSVVSENLQNGISYIKINSFDENTSVKVKEQLEKSEKAVIDLQSLCSDELSYAMETLDLFLGECDMAEVLTGGGKKGKYLSDEAHYNIKIAIIVDDFTSGVSETFAQILKNKAGAVIIGQNKTPGRCFSQGFLQLDDGSCVCITYQSFQPSDSLIKEGVGVDIDVFEADPEKRTAKAVEILSKDNNN